MAARTFNRWAASSTTKSAVSGAGRRSIPAGAYGEAVTTDRRWSTVPETELRGPVVNWRRSSRSISNGACVEAGNVHEAVAVRDSIDRAGGELRYSTEAWQMFLHRVKAGAFELTPSCGRSSGRSVTA